MAYESGTSDEAIQVFVSYSRADTEFALDLVAGLQACGFEAYGGDDSPYVFMDLKGKSSWDMFSEILETAQVVTIPGAGFGPGGEGFLRLSAFASRENCEEASERLKKMFA